MPIVDDGLDSDQGINRVVSTEDEGWASVEDWIRNKCARFGEAFNPPAAPRQLPLVPLDVRIRASEHCGESMRAEALVDFEMARAFWRLWACVDLRLIKGEVEVVEDPDKAIWDPMGERESLDLLHVPGQSWVTITYIADTKRVSEDERTPRIMHGVTHFKNPFYALPGYGVVMCMNSGNVLAHELGHAMGLPHVPYGSEEATDAEVFGMTRSQYSLQPFPDDLVKLSVCLQRANLMNGRDAGSFPNLEARWLSHSQADRARLTITSRRCHEAHAERGLDTIGQVMLDDIPAAFLAETFVTDRHPDLMPPNGLPPRSSREPDRGRPPFRRD